MVSYYALVFFMQSRREGCSKRYTNNLFPAIRICYASMFAGVERPFTFDFSYNSHDRDSSDYAGQETVWEDLGVGVLNNAFDGK